MQSTPFPATPRLLLLLPMFFLAALTQTFAQLPGWPYTRILMIDNSTNSEALTNYQVRAVFNHARLVSAGRSRSDGADIRFTLNCGGPVLSHWIESGLNSVACTAWVKVTNVPARARVFLYLHTGNNSAPNISDPESVFEFYDDFLTDLSKWQRTTGSTISLQNLAPIRENLTWGGNNYIYTNLDFSYLANRGVVETLTQSSVGGGNIIFFVDNPTTPNHYLLQHDIRAPSSNYDFGRRAGAAAASFGALEWQFNPNEPVLTTIEIQSPSRMRHIRSSVLNPSSGTQEVAAVSDNWTWHYIGFSTFSGTATFEVDWVRVRKYTPIEPVVSERDLPSESIAIAPTWLENIHLTCTGDTTIPVILQNRGRDAWIATSFRLARGSAFALTPTTGVTLNNATPYQLALRFIPPQRGVYNDTIIVAISNSCPQEFRIPIRGYRDTIGFRIDGVRRDTVDFGTICPGTTKDSFLILSNLSSVATPFSGINPGNQFLIGVDSLLTPVPVGAQRRLPLRFMGTSRDTVTVGIIKITDECGRSDTAYLRVRTRTPAAFASFDTTICRGTTLRIGGTASGGVGPYTYEWLPAPGLGTRFDSVTTVSPTQLTEYILKITDKNGCVGYDTATVDVGSQLNPSIGVQGTGKPCIGDTVTLGVGAYAQYLWSTGARTPTIRVAASGSYWVEVMSPGGCSGRDTFVVNFSTPPQPVISGVETICLGGSTAYTVPVIAGGSYVWTVPAGGTLQGGQGTPRATVRWNQAGQWTLRVTVANGPGGCAKDTTITVDVGTSLTPPIDTSGATTFCDGDTLLLSTGDFSGYRWSNGDTTKQIVVTRSGVYSVFVFDATGCNGRSKDVSVTVIPRPRPSITGPLAICTGTGRYYASNSQGTATYTWQLEGGGTIVDGQGTDSLLVDWNTEGTWRITVEATSPEGCRGDTTIVVNVAAVIQPLIAVGGDTLLCPGDSVLLDAGAGYDSYRWTTGDTTQSIVVMNPGDYGVTVLVGLCSGSSAPIHVDLHTPATVTIVVNGSALRPSTGTVVQWYLNGSPIPGGTGPELTTTSEGIYEVEILDSNGCAARSAPIDLSNRSTITLPSLTAAPGSRVRIPLLISRPATGNRPIAFTADLAFNRTLLYPLNVDGGSWTVTTDGDSLVMRITATAPSQNADTLGIVNAIALVGNATITALTVRTFAWTDGVGTTSTQDGELTIDGLCVTGGTRLVEDGGLVGLKEIVGNPLKGATSIEFMTIENGRTRLRLFDLLGRPVVTLVDGDISVGSHTTMLDPERVPSGTYFLVLETPTGRWEKMVVKN